MRADQTRSTSLGACTLGQIAVCTTVMAHEPQRISATLSNAPLLADVRAQLSQRLAQGDVGLASLARALHMSERTLRRRLSEHGTSYQILLDEVRAGVACKLVEQATQPFELIAQQIGFADTSSFFHAFKRWTGKTPAQFRREQREE